MTKNPTYTATIHAIIGVGIGMLLTYPLAGIHPVRWALAFVAVGLLGHLYPLMLKK
jgi:hypothetical protein